MTKRIKTLLLAAGLMALILPGCGNSGISDREYSLVWQTYSSREFEEGFFEKLSSEQKKRLVHEAGEKVGVDIEGFASYMREKRPLIYSQIFE